MEINNTLSEGHILDLDIEKLAFGGLGIAHFNNIVIFVKDGIPGQKVKVKISKKKKNYLEAYVVEKITPSKDEQTPICTHFGMCGGCTFQNYNYSSQLIEKYNQVEELFNKMLKTSFPKINAIIGCQNEFNYRNKMEFSYSPNRWILDKNNLMKNLEPAFGLHVKKRFDKIVDISDCYIQGKKSNDIFKFIKKYILENQIKPFNMKTKTGYLKNIIIREGQITNQILINFITTNDDIRILSKLTQLLVKKFGELKGIINTIIEPHSGSSISDKEIILYGQDYIEEKIGKYIYKISSSSFFQTNSKQSKILYDQILKLSELEGDEIVYDLYCGAGSISIYLSEHAKYIYGIEIVMSAVMDAIENSKKNDVKNVDFFHGNLIDFFKNNQEIQLMESPDVVIVDPPRAGIHKNTLNDIMKLKAKKIIYISCNPSTQIRDISILTDAGYTIKEIQPIDMFPHTPHIENIVSLVA